MVSHWSLGGCAGGADLCGVEEGKSAFVVLNIWRYFEIDRPELDRNVQDFLLDPIGLKLGLEDREEARVPNLLLVQQDSSQH